MIYSRLLALVIFGSSFIAVARPEYANKCSYMVQLEARLVELEKEVAVLKAPKKKSQRPPKVATDGQKHIHKKIKTPDIHV
jgi:hypothetical protein